MKHINTLLILIGAFCLLNSPATFAQCPDDNSNSGLTFTTPTMGMPSSLSYNGGEYALLSVVMGDTYSFSTCGGASFDTQLSIYEDGTGVGLSYNDDDCGLQSTANWLATFTGNVRVLLDQFNCQNNGGLATVTVSLVPPPPPPCSPIAGNILYDNGPLVNSVGTGVGGVDESVLQNNTLGMNFFGFGHQVSAQNVIADDFTITGDSWDISKISFFAYQSFPPNTTSTITEVRLEIWDGPPSEVGSNLIFGDLTTNRMTNTCWNEIYRVTENTTGASTDRPVMRNEVEVNTILSAGTYWLAWQTNGTLSSGPWAPPVTINGLSITGNGRQSLNNGLTYGPANDSGTGTPQQDFPFIIEGVEVDPTISQTDEDGDGNPDITDPCACGDPLNIIDGLGNITHFHDFVLVVAGPGQTWEISAINSGAIFTAGLVPIPVGTVLPEIAPGVYRLDLYHPSGVGFNVTVDRTAGGGPFPLMTGGTCDAAICGPQAIPTMGEWGLIILALLLLTFATVFMMGRKTAVAGYGTVSSNGAGIPFNKAAFGKMLAIVMAGLAAVFSAAAFGFGYEMTAADVPGSLIAGPIAAYLLHLIVPQKK